MFGDLNMGIWIISTRIKVTIKGQTNLNAMRILYDIMIVTQVNALCV